VAVYLHCKALGEIYSRTYPFLHYAWIKMRLDVHLLASFHVNSYFLGLEAKIFGI